MGSFLSIGALFMLTTLTTSNWQDNFSESIQADMIKHLEAGQIIFLPQLPFNIEANEQAFLTPDHADPHAKNISYQASCNKLWGVRELTDEQHNQLKAMLDRYSRYAYTLVKNLFPNYVPHLKIARTSFRPIEIGNRKTSYRKDDKRLHVDAFPSAPNQGKRILRVFTNVNPHGEARIWRVGEPFEHVALRFLPAIKKPVLGSAAALRFLRITKSKRTAYDHYMLNMHDLMKANDSYQQEANQQEIHFPAGSTWIVQTDHVSHAAMRGQYVLEQTFSLPVHAMKDESKAPLRVLERFLGRELV